MTETDKKIYIAKDTIVNEFVRAIKEGRVKLEDIPELYKEKVEEILNKS
jgi:Zn-dependent M32 family carboxypeptidase